MNTKSKLSYTERTDKLLLTLPESCGSFKNHLDAAGTLPSTIFQYIYDLSYFVDWLTCFSPYFSNKQKYLLTIQDLSHVTPEDIDDFLSWYRIDNKATKKERSDCTLARKKASLSAFFSFLCARKWLQNNPVSASSKIKIRKKPPIYLDQKEQEAYKNSILHGTGLTGKAETEHQKYVLRDYALALLLLDTGMRISEVQSTEIIDYDLTYCNVVVRRKDAKMDTVYFSDETRDALLSYLNSKNEWQSRNDQPMFTTLDGTRLSIRAMEELIKKYAMASIPQKGKSISPHKMRSTFAMDLYEASGNDILLVKERMAHKSIATTQIYTEARHEKIEESRNFRQKLKDSTK